MQYAIQQSSFEMRVQEALRVAISLSEDPRLDWVAFFRKTLGVNGIIRKLFPEPESLSRFEKTPEYDEIQKILTRMRGNTDTKPEDKEQTKVITVRLPKSLHDLLRAEAHDRQTSMNKLCISKLIQIIDQELVPTEE